MRSPRLFFVFCALVIGCAAQETTSAPIGAEALILGVKYPIDQHPDFVAMKARAEKSEVMAEYWKAIAERNEMAVRLLQSEAQLSQAKAKIESLEKKNP